MARTKQPARKSAASPKKPVLPPVVLPNSAAESFKGARLEDAIEPGSTVRLPELLFFPHVRRVLLQIHPDKKLDFTAYLVLEDYLHHIICTITNSVSALSAGAFLSKKAKSALEFCHIVGEHENELCVFDSDQNSYAWEARDIVKRVIPTELAAHDAKPEAERSSRFAAWQQECADSISSEKILPASTITARDIQTAVRLLIKGELSKHAVSEGTKAVTKLACAHGDQASNSQKAGLVFDVDLVGIMMSQRLGRQVATSSATYLAAVLEYMSAELLELSGNACRQDSGCSVITCAHISRAVQNDEELWDWCKDVTFLKDCTLQKKNVFNMEPVPVPDSNADKLDECEFHFVAHEDSAHDEDLQSYLENYKPQAGDFGDLFVGEGSVTATPSDAEANISKRARHQRVLRDNIYGLEARMFRLLAARANVMCISTLLYEELREISRRFLEKIVRKMVTFAEYDRVCVISVEHVVRSLDQEFYGSGRNRQYQQPHIPLSSVGGRFVSKRDTILFSEVFNNEYREAVAVDAEKVQVAREESAAKEAKYDAGEESDPESTLGKMGELQKKSIKLMKEMQRETYPVIPMRPIARVVCEIGQDFRANLQYEPVIFSILGKLLEGHLVGVLRDAGRVAQLEPGKKSFVNVNHLTVARSVRGDRYQ